MQSKIQKADLTFIQEGVVVTKTYNAFQVLVSELAPAVTLASRLKVPNYQQLKKSVLTELINPVIITPNTRENYNRAVATVDKIFVEPYHQDKKYLVLMGNQRLSILDVKTISAMLVHTWQESVLLNKYLCQYVN